MTTLRCRHLNPMWMSGLLHPRLDDVEFCYKQLAIERLQGVWPKIIPVAIEMPTLYVNFSSLNYPNLNDKSWTLWLIS